MSETREDSDVIHISRALGALRRWWMIAAILVAGIASYTATSMAIGAATADITSLGDRVEEHRTVLSRRVDKLEAALQSIPDKLGEVREALAELGGEVRALRRSRP